MKDFTENILTSKKRLIGGLPAPKADAVEEGGCGVVGFAADVPICGRNIFEASIQMHNRGNGKGGGIAAANLVPEQLGVDAATLQNDYILQVALLDSSVENRLEEDFIRSSLRIAHRQKLDHIDDYRDVGLEVRPPDIVRYFVRVKEGSLAGFAKENGMEDAPPRMVEDEFIYQNSFKLNQRYYASLGQKQAFVLSHARNLMIFKIVGYAEQVVKYYGLQGLQAHIWIAHQRYPTKGRVWHPAGAHPFIGMNEALVHNGDFANYYSISQYLRQHNVVPQFLTDTEVSVLLFDMLHRTYGYPLEYVIEALAPTTERDFNNLPEHKKKVYRAIQSLHIHSSPDGPWFFIIARSEPDNARYQLLGITDTSMLRPQVFALQRGDVSIGLVGSEKQAIDATLHSLSSEDQRFRPVADRYWNARGGSHTDGGAFAFTLEGNDGKTVLTCSDKFGKQISVPSGEWAVSLKSGSEVPANWKNLTSTLEAASNSGDCEGLFTELASIIGSWGFGQFRRLLEHIILISEKGGKKFEWALNVLLLLNDRHYDCGNMKRSVILQLVRGAVKSILDGVPSIADDNTGPVRRIDWETRNELREPLDDDAVLVVYANEFPMEGDHCDARLLVAAYKLGWKRFVIYGLKGQRFTGCGFGPDTSGVRIDVIGSSGDYLASGIDGMEIIVHDNGQDQLGQIIKSGRLVVYGDVGQAFMYGAKGGEVYVMGNAAGRPLINAVGKPRVVINGTCLDFLAESFMAGDPHNGGGFVVLNGMEFDHKGNVVPQDSPYPGANIFSLASGGAVFVRDPHRQMDKEQLNGGAFAKFTSKDWSLIMPYLKTNEKYFGISIENDLLQVNGKKLSPVEVYRKVCPVNVKELANEDTTD